MSHLVLGWAMIILNQFKPVTKGYPTHLGILLYGLGLMNAAYDIAPDLVDPSEPLKRPEGIVTRSFCGLTGLTPSTSMCKCRSCSNRFI